MFPRSTHETFAEKLYQTFKDHKRFSKPKLSRSDFTICHYAGDVTYQTEYFLDKNKDYVVAEHQALLSASRCSFVSSLFPSLPEESSKSSKFSSIGSRFKQQLQALLETLGATEPHYVRCVKPNNLLKPSIFENSNVLQQLRCGGVMEAIRISCAGFPTRRKFDEFLSRFSIIAPEILDGSCDEVTACERLLEKAALKGYQVGKTKVFLRAGQMAELDARRTEVLGKSACVIQRKARSYFAQKRFIAMQVAAIQIQALSRGQLARCCYESKRREVASMRIQKDTRMYLSRKHYKMLCSSAVIIQTGMRGMAAHNELHFRKQTNAAICIQTECRRHLARGHYLRMKTAAINIQCAWRGKLACRELQKLKMAAREMGALQAAKSKLEKEVEELTYQLQLEKRTRADIEEAKTKEIAKLQSALEEMRLQFQETRELPIKEHENANKAVEEVPIMQHSGVIDDEMVNKLIAENEELKAMVSSLQKKIDEREKKYEEREKISEEPLKQASEAESKIIELKTEIQRLEAKLSDIEAENQILKQQASTNSPAAEMTVSESYSNFANLWLSSLQENVQTLINCVSQDLGFSSGKPVAAFTIYKCLVHWKSLEEEKTGVFDFLIKLVGAAIENEDMSHMAYWLSNTSILLFLLQRTLKPTDASQSAPTSFFGRMTQGFRSSGSANISFRGIEVQMVEGKYPAVLFKQQLSAYMEIMYGIVRDNLKKDIAPHLSSCIQAPRTSEGNNLQSSSNSPTAVQWQNITESLNGVLSILKEKCVPTVLCQKMFTQIFSYINVQLFNSLIQDGECCTVNYGKYVKAGLAELELWCTNEAKEEYAGTSWEELKHTIQVVGLLVCSLVLHQAAVQMCTLRHLFVNNKKGTP
ncbi:Myosin ATPase [Bertholletia excelsa]